MKGRESYQNPEHAFGICNDSRCTRGLVHLRRRMNTQKKPKSRRTKANSPKLPPEYTVPTFRSSLPFCATNTSQAPKNKKIKQRMHISQAFFKPLVKTKNSSPTSPWRMMTSPFFRFNSFIVEARVWIWSCPKKGKAWSGIQDCLLQMWEISVIFECCDLGQETEESKIKKIYIIGVTSPASCRLTCASKVRATSSLSTLLSAMTYNKTVDQRTKFHV